MEKLTQVQQFLGADKVKNVELSDRKTYMGKNVWKITLEGDKTLELPEVVAVKALTLVASNATDLRDRILNPLVENIVALLLEQEIKIIDIDYLMQKMTGTVNHHLMTAENILWGKDAMYDKTLFDINKVIKNNGQQNKTKNTATSHSAGTSPRQKRKGSVES